MPARKTPILLRPAPMSGEIMALYRYSRKTVRGREIIDCGSEGRWPVTADFDAIVLEMLVDRAPNIVGILDGAALGLELSPDERVEVRDFREALVEIIERHNARLPSKERDGA